MASLNLYVVTLNCACSPIDIDAFASQLFSGLSTNRLPDLLVLSLQEIAPLSDSFIGGSFLAPYFSRFHHAIQKAPRLSGISDTVVYTPVITRNVGMVGIMVFAKDATSIQDLEAGGVGVGASDMGHKGAVGARFVYGSGGSYTELAFVAAHLAAMEDEVPRRNKDWENIVRGLIFTSTSQDGQSAASLPRDSEEQPLLSGSPQDGSIYKPTSHLFFAGDLNYRTSTTKPSPSDYIDSFPQPSDENSSPNHFSKLFERDQLNQERIASRTCHGLVEAPITFPPTYKYDPEESFNTQGEQKPGWHWAKHRWPSWCDRILYLDIPSWLKSEHPEAKITTHKYSALPLLQTSDHRAVALEVSVPLLRIPQPDGEETGHEDPRINPPFQVNAGWKRQREWARTLELFSGFTAYFTTTAKGGGIVLATLAGVIGAYLAIGALLE